MHPKPNSLLHKLWINSHFPVFSISPKQDTNWHGWPLDSDPQWTRDPEKGLQQGLRFVGVAESVQQQPVVQARSTDNSEASHLSAPVSNHGVVVVLDQRRRPAQLRSHDSWNLLIWQGKGWEVYRSGSLEDLLRWEEPSIYVQQLPVKVESPLVQLCPGICVPTIIPRINPKAKIMLVWLWRQGCHTHLTWANRPNQSKTRVSLKDEGGWMLQPDLRQQAGRTARWTHHAPSGHFLGYPRRESVSAVDKAWATRLPPTSGCWSSICWGVALSALESVWCDPSSPSWCWSQNASCRSDLSHRNSVHFFKSDWPAELKKCLNTQDLRFGKWMLKNKNKKKQLSQLISHTVNNLWGSRTQVWA